MIHDLCGTYVIHGRKALMLRPVMACLHQPMQRRVRVSRFAINRDMENGIAGVAVPFSMSRRGALRDSLYVLPYRAPRSAWRHITTVCDRAGVVPKGMHSLRHPYASS